MDYRYLKAFILTAEHASFSKAAESLKIAQSAVSRQIKLLEESLGEELIIRSSKKVILTAKGKSLYLAAQRFDQSSQDIFEKEDLKPIRIGILHGLLKNWFAPKLAKFYKKSPGEVRIDIKDKRELKKGIEDGLYDIIFSTENVQSELTTSLKLFDERLVLISKDEVNKKKLEDYTWIVFSEEDHLFSLTKKTSGNIIIVQDMHTIVDLVKNNVGIAIVPDHVLKKTDPLKIQDVASLKKSEIYLTTLSYKTMPVHIQEICEICKR